MEGKRKVTYMMRIAIFLMAIALLIYLLRFVICAFIFKGMNSDEYFEIQAFYMLLAILAIFIQIILLFKRGERKRTLLNITAFLISFATTGLLSLPDRLEFLISQPNLRKDFEENYKLYQKNNHNALNCQCSMFSDTGILYYEKTDIYDKWCGDERCFYKVPNQSDRKAFEKKYKDHLYLHDGWYVVYRKSNSAKC